MALTFDELARLVEQSEDSRVELKVVASEAVLRDLSTDLAALANARGGAIVFGITDEKQFVGLDSGGDERARISQEAAKCRPQAQIDFDEVCSNDNKRFLVVRVAPAGTLPLSDFRDKFPVRVGNVTAYLDGSGFISWINERGLLKKEGQQSYPEFKREPISETEASALASGLNSSAKVRMEALRDFAHLSHRHVVLSRINIAKPIGRILRDGAKEEAKLIIEALRSIVLWGPEEEKRSAADWFPRIAELARDTRNPELARMAWDVLMCARRPEAADILAEWVMTEPEAYSALVPSNLLQNVRFYGLDHPIRAAMHRILSETTDEEIGRRASQILEALRRASG